MSLNKYILNHGICLKRTLAVSEASFLHATEVYSHFFNAGNFTRKLKCQTEMHRLLERIIRSSGPNHNTWKKRQRKESTQTYKEQEAEQNKHTQKAWQPQELKKKKEVWKSWTVLSSQITKVKPRGGVKLDSKLKRSTNSDEIKAFSISTKTNEHDLTSQQKEMIKEKHNQQ